MLFSRSSPYDREILRLAVPAFGSLIAEPLYILADTAVVGHLGTPELGGLAVAATLLVTSYTLFIFLAYGTTASVARLLGAGNRALAAHQGAQGMWLAGLIGVGLALLGFVFAGPLVGAMGASGVVRDHALTYFRVSLPGLPFLLLTLAGTGYLRGIQDTKTPLFVTLGSASANLAIELVLIYGFGYGIGASALATVIAQIGAAVFYVWAVSRDVHGAGSSLRPHLGSLLDLARIGLDLFLRTVSLRGVLLISTAVAARMGTVQVGAHQVALEIWNFLALALDAVAIAGQAITARLLGAGRAEEARAAGRRMIEWGVVSGVVLGLLIAATRGLLPPLFSNDAAVVSGTAYVLWFVAVLQPVNSVAFVLDGVLIGAGDGRFLAWAMAGAAVLFALLAGGVLASGGGLGMLWAAIGAFMTARATSLLLRFRGPGWQVTGAARI